MRDIKEVCENVICFGKGRRGGLGWGNAPLIFTLRPSLSLYGTDHDK